MYLLNKPSKRKQVWALLDKDNGISMKQLTLLTGVFGQVLRNYRYLWKCNHLNEIGSQCNQSMTMPLRTHPDSQHKCYAEALVPSCLDREKYVEVTAIALEQGWVLSKNTNHALLFENSLGHIAWQVNGNVRVYAKRIGRIGALKLMAKVKELVGCAFEKLIGSNVILAAFLDTIEWHDSHDVYETDRTLPYMVIQTNDMKLLGHKIKLGDLTHPNSVEDEVVHPPILKQYNKLVLDLKVIYEKHFESAVAEKAELKEIIVASTEVIKRLSPVESVKLPAAPRNLYE